MSEGGFNPDAEGPSATASSQELGGTVGENLVLEKNNEPDMIYVPITGKNQVAVYDKDDLLKVQTFEAGEEPPSQAVLDRDSGTLFVLSESGSTVTAVDVLGEKEVVANVRTNAGEDALVQTGAGERSLGRWTRDPLLLYRTVLRGSGVRGGARGLGAGRRRHPAPKGLRS